MPFIVIYLAFGRETTSVDQRAEPREYFIHNETGSLLDEASLPGLEIDHARLVAQNHANRSSARTAQRNRKTGVPGETSALRDRANQTGYPVLGCRSSRATWRELQLAASA